MQDAVEAGNHVRLRPEVASEVRELGMGRSLSEAGL